ncbi:solute carrier family 25 member 45-like isoform X2 [Bacillus rossius redtenbacheri]
MGFPLLSAGTLNSVFFGTYANTLRHLHAGGDGNPPRRLNVFLAGCAGGVAQVFLACPVELIKIRLQAHTGSLSPLRCVAGVCRTQGPAGLYRGFHVMLWRDVPAFGVYVLAYEEVTATWPGSQGSVLQQILAGGTAGMLSWSAIIPLDVVKSRIQSDNPENPRYRGIADCLVKSYRNDGLLVFGRGFSLIVLRAFPVNAAIFVGYEWCRKTLCNVDAPT